MPLPLWVQLEQSLAIMRQRAKGHDASSGGFGLASCSRGLVFLRGTLQAQRAEGWCSQKRTLQTQMSNEDTDGLAPSLLDYYSSAARAASHEFSTASEEDPRRETPGSDSHLDPEAWCSRKQAHRPKEPRTVVPGRGHCTPTKLQRGYRRVGNVGL